MHVYQDSVSPHTSPPSTQADETHRNTLGVYCCSGLNSTTARCNNTAVFFPSFLECFWSLPRERQQGSESHTCENISLICRGMHAGRFLSLTLLGNAYRSVSCFSPSPQSLRCAAVSSSGLQSDSKARSSSQTPATRMADAHFYPIGVKGVPWGQAERAAWNAQHTIERSYRDEVLTPLEKLKEGGKWAVLQYGALSCDPDRYPVHVVKSSAWDVKNPTLLVTGGVHGYETSGVQVCICKCICKCREETRTRLIYIYYPTYVYAYAYVYVYVYTLPDTLTYKFTYTHAQGALLFLQTQAEAYSDRVNVVVAPCVSPWGYEHIQRWNANADDPNRGFKKDADRPRDECIALMTLLDTLRFMKYKKMHDIHRTF
jgi:hypothetical protein